MGLLLRSKAPAAALASLGTMIGCAQIIGADKRFLDLDTALEPTADSGNATADGEAPATGDAEPIKEPEQQSTLKPCADGEKRCAGACVSIDDPSFGCSPTSCDPCSVPFSASTRCTNGKCAVATCRAGRADCNGVGTDGCEADLNDAKTCGNCTTACGTNAPLCNPAGQCVATCDGTLTLCGTSCVDLKTSAGHCGQCNKVCAGATNAIGVCANSTCGISCNTGFDQCDGNAANGCEALKPYYVDADGDGFGAGPKVGDACVPPAGHSLDAADCADNNANVKPGQTQYFATGYTTAGGATSFDYDCNGFEQSAPGYVLGGGCVPCVQGYMTKAVPGPNPYCGSTVYRVCGSVACMTTSAAAYRCR